MSGEKDLFKLFLEGGWLVSVIGAAGMLARLITNPIQGSWKEYLKKIVVAAITSTIAWFLVEQMEISSITKAITYGVVGVVSPELIEGIVKIAQNFSKNPKKFLKK